MWTDWARYVLSTVKVFEQRAGLPMYAFSFQNEPMFRQSFNSARYPQAAYGDLLQEIGPKIHAAFPNVKLFGPENMLETECGRHGGVEFDPWWYTGNILARPRALEQLGAFAVHGYSDGVVATPSSKLARLWTNFHKAVAHTGRPIWMTETSGYVD